ncbi:hypothetical protein O6H91_02G123600 [Diphasiastrum complanatum]|uniref:Uncharacterized protein n=1 Tax=Diphasiastrum complanatum TaxID=34168 RepID=A0ACC2EK75_DIPCM|nr:hypothetical protein O6H91_02G123600 [Diphasiastrum complanatum]
MGNFMCGVGNSKQSIAVLRVDGKVVEFTRKLRVADLMMSYPHHVLCNASFILSRRKSKVLPPNAMLQYGKVYFLIPISSDQTSGSFSFLSSNSDTDPLLQTKTLTERNGTKGSANFVIPQELLDRIFPDRHNSSRKKKYSRKLVKQPSRKKSSAAWSPGLESISELIAR